MDLDVGGSIQKIKISNIKLGDRQRKDLGDISGLELSIDRKGLIYPIVVEKLKDDNYLLIAGERRLTAFVNLKRKEIPAILKEDIKDDVDRKELELEENFNRKGLNYIEHSQAVAELDKLKREKYSSKLPGRFGRGWTQKDTANALGISEAKVSQDIALANAVQKHPEIEEQGTRKEALRVMRQIEDGIRPMHDESVLVTKMKECFINKTGLEAVKSLPPDTVDCMFVNFHEQSIEEIVSHLYRVMKYTAHGFAFIAMERQAELCKHLEFRKFNHDTKPFMWHVKTKDDYVSFIWFSKGFAEPPKNVNRHYSYSPDKDSIHTKAIPYSLYSSLVLNSCAKDSFIVGVNSYSLSLIRVCYDNRRNVNVYCGTRNVYEQCLMKLGAKVN